MPGSKQPVVAAGPDSVEWSPRRTAGHAAISERYPPDSEGIDTGHSPGALLLRVKQTQSELGGPRHRPLQWPRLALGQRHSRQPGSAEVARPLAVFVASL